MTQAKAKVMDYVRIARLDHWIKNLFILPGFAVAVFMLTPRPALGAGVWADLAVALLATCLAASANYAGYLLGAILAMRARAHSAHRLCLWSVAGTALCLGVLALPMPVWLIVAVRGVANSGPTAR